MLHGALALLLLVLASGRSAESAPSTTSRWVRSIEAAEKKYREKWGAVVKDLETGQTIFAYNPEQRLIPASNRKIVTFVLALEKFGPEYRFKTELGLTKARKDPDGYLAANVVLRSNGDPSLVRKYLENQNPATAIAGWVGQIAEAGFTKIRGDFIIDASAFGPGQENFSDAWEESYRNKVYAPLPTAIALSHNLVQIIADPSSNVGRPGKLRYFPSRAGLNPSNFTRSVSGRIQGLEARFDPETGNLRVSGRLGISAHRQVVSLPHVRPLQYLKEIIEEAIRDEGIELTGNVRIISDPVAARSYPLSYLVVRHESPPLPQLLDVVMRESDNFIAEQLWRATAHRTLGLGTFEESRRSEANWYRSKDLTWIEPGYDGSGLSRKNRIAPSEQVSILRTVYVSPYRNYLLDALPSSGRTGTLKNRSMGVRRGRIRAKTGTLSGVSALSGFILDKGGEPRWVFSLLGNAPNNTNGRLTMRANQLMKILVRKMDSPAQPPLKRYRKGTKTYVG